MRDGSFTLEAISSSRHEVARFTDEKNIVLYHDNSASDRGLSFRTGVDSAENVQSRTDRVQLVAQKVASDYFQDHTGRPDIIVLKVQTEDVSDYLITEVKNSTRTKPIRQGIKEALEYVAFLRLNNDFVFEDPDNEDIFGDGWNGLLVIQDLDTKTASINEINILQASELDNLV